MDGEPPATWYPSYAWRDPRWFEFDRETLSDLRLRAADARRWGGSVRRTMAPARARQG